MATAHTLSLATGATMSRRKLGEKEIRKKGLDIKFRISHTVVHDTTDSTGPTAVARSNPTDRVLSSLARTSLR